MSDAFISSKSNILLYFPLRSIGVSLETLKVTVREVFMQFKLIVCRCQSYEHDPNTFDTLIYI